MFEYLQSWLRQIESNHGVNPIIFAIIYCAGVVPFWFSIYKILTAMKTRNHRKAVTFIFVLAVVIVAPFTYAAIVGHNLPIWFWGVATTIILYSGYSVLRRIRQHRRVS